MKISEIMLQDLKDKLDRCDGYNIGVQAVVEDITNQILEENEADVKDGSIIDISNLDESLICTVQDFAEQFWDKAIEEFLSVLKKGRWT